MSDLRVPVWIVALCARFFTVLALVGGLTAAPAFADVQKRVALVIGNGAYVAAPKLTNPVDDAKAVSASLKRLGFEVVEGYDLSAADMQNKIGAFSQAISGAKAALVYYAGHGVAFQDDNYLLPIDIVLKTPSDLDLKAINLSVVLKLMKREDAIDVVILDACRNNPFAEELSRSAKSRSLFLDGGLASVDTTLARGTLIAFATDPKKTALDGTPGDHSPFTKALLAHLEDENVPIDTVFNRVRSDVNSATSQQQTPWVNTSLIGEFVLNPSAAPAAAPAAATATPSTQGGDRVALDGQLWAAAEKSDTIEDYKAYLDQMPNGAFVQIAKNRMARLDSRSALAIANPAQTPTPAAPAAPGPAPSAVPSPQADAMAGETGSQATEDALKLDVSARKDVEARLMAMGFDPGDFTGVFSFKTRASISEWQKRRAAPVTGYLGPLQYAAMVRETADLRPATAARTAVVAPPAVKKKKRLPPAGQTAQGGAVAPPPAQGGYDNGAATAGAFLGGALLGGALGAAIHH